MKVSTRLIAETALASIFCGLFSAVLSILYQMYLTSMSDRLGLRYALMLLIVNTVTVFVPLLIFNIAKLKFMQNKKGSKNVWTQ